MGIPRNRECEWVQWFVQIGRNFVRKQMEEEKLNAYIDSIQRAGPRGGVVERQKICLICRVD